MVLRKEVPGGTTTTTTTPPATSFLRRVLRRLAWSTLPGRFLAGKLLLCLPTHRGQ